MATVAIRSNRVMTRSSTRTSPHMSDHDDTEDCCTMENAPVNLERVETSSHASYPTSEPRNKPIHGGNKNRHSINNNIDSGKQSSGSVAAHSSSSSTSKSSGAIPLPNLPSSSTATSTNHASLHLSSRAASPIIVSTHASSSKNINHNTSMTNQPESNTSEIRTDCSNRPGSRSSQQSSISPAPIIITSKSGTPSVLVQPPVVGVEEVVHVVVLLQPPTARTLLIQIVV